MAVNTLRTAGVVDGSLLAVGVDTVLDVVVDDRLAGRVGSLGLDALVVLGVASVAGVDVGLETGTVAREGLHDLLVLAEGSVHLVHLDVVQEDARTERARNSGTELSVTSLEDSLGGLVKDVLGEVLIVHGQTNTREEVQQSLVVLVAEDTSKVGEGGRVGHVNGDGVTVTERRVGDQLVKRRPAEPCQ